MPLAEVLADPPEPATLSGFKSVHMAKLERLILDEASSMSAAQIDCQILSKLVARFNATGRSLPRPRTLLLFALPKSPFARDLRKSGNLSFSLRCMEEWKSSEKSWIKEWRSSSTTDKAVRTSPPPPLALVVFSGILHGGLLHRGAVVGVARALLDPEQHTGLMGNQVYVNLVPPGHGQLETEFRCWRPDAQTACMIQADLQPNPSWDAGDTDAVIGKHLFRAIHREMRSKGVPALLQPKSLNHLLDTVALCARAEVPAVLVDYATRTFVSHSAKPRVMQRLYWQAQDQPETEASLSDESHLPSADLAEISSNPEEPEPEGLRELRVCLSSNNPSTVLADWGTRSLLIEVVCKLHGFDYLEFFPKLERPAVSEEAGATAGRTVNVGSIALVAGAVLVPVIEIRPKASFHKELLARRRPAELPERKLVMGEHVLVPPAHLVMGDWLDWVIEGCYFRLSMKRTAVCFQRCTSSTSGPNLALYISPTGS